MKKINEVNVMERKLPKNIRQIGNVSDNPKIYVEDYVDTFFAQIEEKAKETTVGAFLIGETFRKDDQDYIFVSGAIQMEGLEQRGQDISYGDKTWKKACEECKRYFTGSTIVGWMLAGDKIPLNLNNNLIKLHEKTFMKKSRVLVMKDAVSKEEAYYVYKYNDLMKISGHYVYYEKNPNMQDYMISKRKQNCVTPSEDYEDRATKNFRSIVQKNQSQSGKGYGVNKRRGRSLRYAMNAVMVLLIVLAGVMILERDNVNGNGTSAWGNFFANKTTENKEQTSVNALNNQLDQSEDVSLSDQMEKILQKSDENQEGDTLVQGVADESVENNSLNEEDAATEDDGSDEATSNSDGGMETESIAQGDEGRNDTVEQNQYDSGDMYIVKDGDTLARISINVYGTMDKVEAICDANALENGDYIYIGQEIRLP